MSRSLAPLVVWAGLAAACTHAKTNATPDMGPAFQADPANVYVAKVKDILVGLPPSDAELKAVQADPTQLGALVDQWMALPEYQQKMMVFFELAFQQTQLTSADFTDMLPPQGLGPNASTQLLLQNARESFARTVLALASQGRPLTDAFTTKQLMMTPALMELYAFLDARRLDDNGKVTDDFAAANPKLPIVLEASAGPIAPSDTLNPQGALYMHWYDPDIGKLNYADPSCNVDPVSFNANGYGLHLLLYGSVYNFKSATGVNCNIRAGSATAMQLSASDFTTWKLVTLRAPNPGEATTRFYDVPGLRAATELVLKTPHPGFFSTPAFFANWPTNTSNQMRVTINQALIVATGAAVDGTDATSPASTPGLDAVHAAPGTACFSCHQTLDPTRAILSSTYSYFYYSQTDPALVQQKGLFAFQNVIAPVASIDDFAATLATHPLVAQGWAQKLCYYVNSTPCAADDPEFQRVVGVFKSSNLSWNALVKALVTSPLTTNVKETKTTAPSGQVVAVARRDHLCAALDSRLGLADVCGRDLLTAHAAKTVVPEIVSGLPSDGYGRGSVAPVLPNQPTLFYRAGLENICGAVADLVIDAKPNSNSPNAKQWQSSAADAAIADFVATVMGLAASDPRAAQAKTILTAHHAAALNSGATPTDALKSTFVAACLAPSAIAIGM
jgi:hypothetical protein